MGFNLRKRSLLWLALFLFTSSLIAIEASGQETVRGSNDGLNRLEGQLLLVGGKQVSAKVQKLFIKMTGNGKLKLALFAGPDDEVDVQLWQQHFSEFKLFRIGPNGGNLTQRDLDYVYDSTCYWLAGDVAQGLLKNGLSKRLQTASSSGIVVGGNAAGAESMGTRVPGKQQSKEGLDLLPNSVVWSEAVAEKRTSLEDVLKQHPKRLGWRLPKESVVVIHNGRRIGVMGGTPITLQTAATDTWPARKEQVSEPFDALPYSADLFAWNRSAIARTASRFPPVKTLVPEVKRGQLLLIGGGGSTDAMWNRFIQAAGGKQAKIVCLEQSERSSIAKLLKDKGCENVEVLFGTNSAMLRAQASQDGEFLKTLKQADAIFLGGGRTYRFMESYLNTKAHEAMRALLSRGGVIGGTSAGAQIQGDFLVRGDPKTNRTLWLPGNDQGFAFLRGVIIDAHFRQRGRHESFPALNEKFPQMLGIGIDEKTALWVQGTTAEVIGANAVTFYDYQNRLEKKEASPRIDVLRAGQKFDFKQRMPLKED